MVMALCSCTASYHAVDNLPRPPHGHTTIIEPHSVVIDGNEYIEWMDGFKYKNITSKSTYNEVKVIMKTLEHLVWEMREVKFELGARNAATPKP